MAGVAWMKRETGHEAISIISASPYPQVFVCLGSTAWRVTAGVHYVPDLKRSLPHMEDHCQWCKYPVTVKSWFPVQKCPCAFTRSIMSEASLKLVPPRLPDYSSWKPKVLEIPPSAAELLGKLAAGLVFAVVRGEGQFHKKVLWHVYDRLLENTLPPFDVRPYLEKSWGINRGPLYAEK
jgi:hypothetical protein